MITISLCMIVRNEEDTLPRCLKSVQGIADEIIVVDTGSTDSTQEIAKQFTDQVYTFPWTDDFSAARNFAFSKGTKEYLLWMDADDLLLEEDRERFLQLKETLSPQVDVVMMPYRVAFDASGAPTFSYYRERLLKNHQGFWWEGRVHEAITIHGRVEYSEAGITHKKLHPGDPDRNLRIYQDMLAKGQTLSPREEFYYSRELVDHRHYEEAARMLEQFLNNPAGWVENKLDACRLLAGCYRQLGRKEERLQALLRGLSLAVPRGELCCELGQYFFEENRYPEAVFWYETALSRPRLDHLGGFVLPDCYGFIPAIQLCVCLDRMGRREEAVLYNELAATFRPDAKEVAYNRAYFARLSENQTTEKENPPAFSPEADASPANQNQAEQNS